MRNFKFFSLQMTCSLLATKTRSFGSHVNAQSLATLPDSVTKTEEFTDLPNDIVTLQQGAALSVTPIDQSLPARSPLKGTDKYSAGKAVKVFVCLLTNTVTQQQLCLKEMLMPCYH